MKERNAIFVELPKLNVKLCCQNSLRKCDIEELKNLLKKARSASNIEIKIEDEAKPNTVYERISVRKTSKNPVIYTFKIKARVAHITKKSIQDRKFPTVFNMFKHLCL